jgi:hypothetical protein
MAVVIRTVRLSRTGADVVEVGDHHRGIDDLSLLVGGCRGFTIETWEAMS